MFNEKYRPTLVSEFKFNYFEHNSTKYRLQLWDIAGEDINCTITKLLAKDAHGVIIMCDATIKASLEDTNRWKKVIDDNYRFQDGGLIPSILVENKVDLLPKREQNDDTRLQKLQKFAKDNNYDRAFQISVKNGINVNESVLFLLKEIIRRFEGDSE